MPSPGSPRPHRTRRACPRCCAPPCASSAPGEDGQVTVTDGFASEMYEDSSLDATARIVDAGGEADERTVEAALRPRRLADLSGQSRVRDQLALVLEAAKRRGTAPDHVLFSGPPGLGKTTLAMIVAAEL